MERSLLSGLSWFLVLAFGLGPAFGTEGSFVPGEILVCPNAAAHATPTEPYATFLVANDLRVLEVDAVSGVLRIAVPVGRENDFCARFAARDDVAYAELNGTGRGGSVPNDTHFGDQWHLSNPLVIGADVSAPGAWDITTGSATIVVALLDTGIDTNHPEFAGRIDPNGMDFVNTDADPEADHPHGSWVAGCLAANANNSFGVSGVDWQCRILPVKVLDASNSGTTMDLAQGLNYVATQADVRVVSLSLVDFPRGFTINNALQNVRNAGKIVLACAGNGGLGNADVSYPGASPLTISVGATTFLDQRASFSATGSALDFVAPGEDIVTVRHGSSSNNTQTVDGCSFATPIVTGVVSLLLARAEVLGVTLDQAAVYALLVAGADDQVGPANEDSPGRDDFYGHGRVNALASLLALGPPPTPFVRGDVNEDGVLNLVDVVVFLGGLFSGTPLIPLCQEAAETNGDSLIDLSDVIRLLDRLFVGGSPLPPPVGCGPDPEPSTSLGCTSFSACP